MPIIACTDELMPDAESLVKSVFPLNRLIERLCYTVIGRTARLAYRSVMRFDGVKAQTAFLGYLAYSGEGRGHDVGG